MAKFSRRGNTARVRTLLLLLLGAWLASACAAIPLGVSHRTLRSGTPDAQASGCYPVAPDHAESSSYAGRVESLDPAEIDLLIWNTHKGQDASWRAEFAELSRDRDLLVLQEALLGDELRNLLRRRTLSWNLATTFVRFRTETGVMTVSPVAPASACVQRTMEPLLSLPKSTLISEYPLKGRRETLLVGNVHAINFSLGTVAFRSQLERLASLLDEHRGPMIVAGDFNDWSRSRAELLDRTLAEKRHMGKVAFAGRGPRTIFGRAVDHVYYRGLDVVDSRVFESSSSDHDAIWVSFAQSDEGAL